MLCPHEQGGLGQCGHFAGKGGGRVNFSRICGEFFYGRPPNNFNFCNFELKIEYIFPDFNSFFSIESYLEESFTFQRQ